MTEEGLQFAKQGRGVVVYWAYRPYIHILHNAFEVFPFIKKVALSKFGRKLLPLTKLQVASGLLDRNCMLAWQICSALAEEKIPVVCPPVLSFGHNHNRPVFAPWSKYYDMQNITATFIDENRNLILERKIKVISESDFIKEYNFWKIIRSLWGVRIVNFKKSTNLREVHKTKNIILKTTHYIADVSRLINNMERKVENTPFESIQIKFTPSQEASKIAEKVANKLGEFYLLRLRRGDVKKRNEALSNEILKNMVQANVREGSQLYIMTNEEDRSSFDFLQNDYKVYQYFDFPELVEIVSGKDADNYMLFTVERVLLKSARLCLAPTVEDEGRIVDYQIRYISFAWQF